TARLLVLALALEHEASLGCSKRGAPVTSVLDAGATSYSDAGTRARRRPPSGARTRRRSPEPARRSPSPTPQPEPDRSGRGASGRTQWEVRARVDRRQLSQ